VEVVDRRRQGERQQHDAERDVADDVVLQLGLDADIAPLCVKVLPPRQVCIFSPGKARLAVDCERVPARIDVLVEPKVRHHGSMLRMMKLMFQAALFRVPDRPAPGDHHAAHGQEDERHVMSHGDSWACR